jgi:hypothetical protein
MAVFSAWYSACSLLAAIIQQMTAANTPTTLRTQNLWIQSTCINAFTLSIASLLRFS